MPNSFYKGFSITEITICADSSMFRHKIGYGAEGLRGEIIEAPTLREVKGHIDMFLRWKLRDRGAKMNRFNRWLSATHPLKGK